MNKSEFLDQSHNRVVAQLITQTHIAMKEQKIKELKDKKICQQKNVEKEKIEK
ncbi:MAG: hypothetical protein LBJ00_03765 [Planctomycetaceae bacterium]|jgi:hypothetical protein|nr:hypothetical protein [Planctomycetaceae bacterium]